MAHCTACRYHSDEHDRLIGAVEKIRKMRYNESSDREQFARYKAVLGKNAPKSFKDFQKVKYEKSKKWRTMKYQYRVVNRYKVDSGSMSAADIPDLDDKVITEKRNNFTSKFKRSGNIAGAFIDDDNDSLYLAHSRVNTSAEAGKYHGNYEIVTLNEHRRFEYIDVPDSAGGMRTETFHDTEAKLFEYFADLYGKKPFSSITMLSERGMCDSCKGVMSQFKEQFTDVSINVVSNKKINGDVWKYRRR